MFREKDIPWYSHVDDNSYLIDTWMYGSDFIWRVDRWYCKLTVEWLLSCWYSINWNSTNNLSHAVLEGSHGFLISSLVSSACIRNDYIIAQL